MGENRWIYICRPFLKIIWGPRKNCNVSEIALHQTAIYGGSSVFLKTLVWKGQSLRHMMIKYRQIQVSHSWLQSLAAVKVSVDQFVAHAYKVNLQAEALSCISCFEYNTRRYLTHYCMLGAQVLLWVLWLQGLVKEECLWGSHEETSRLAPFSLLTCTSESNNLHYIHNIYCFTMIP